MGDKSEGGKDQIFCHQPTAKKIPSSGLFLPSPLNPSLFDEWWGGVWFQDFIFHLFFFS